MHITKHTNKILKLEFIKYGFVANNIITNLISFRGIFLFGILNLEFWVFVVLPMISLKIICPPLFRFIICLITKKSVYSYTFDKLSNKLYIKYKKIFGEYYFEEEDLTNIKEIEIHETSNDRGDKSLDVKLVFNTNKKLPLVLHYESSMSRKIVKQINQFLDIGIYEWH